MPYLRIIFNVLIFGSVLFFPWWFTIIIAIFFLSVFNAYEVLFWGLFADMLYGVSTPNFFGIQFIFTIIFTLFFICARILKKKLIHYDI
ncbi:hypothetical protein COT82_02565 [Candidatus Campbellbacteria bacterium CG10_big_fil_rev_8_21_14_0_10_35_52]|uniref:Uncharacterized protein n=1 Tax=Candidatus Campbellbacteria bacterium CG10_big_fil_rev_8_21_14_0_10_35_52 TaxID=1974527 RepID=A0A2M6WUT0_9BACT|nr:MAG: hypothetical protein COT82_02565 [Candidatus Campbellbacteria bacterium CG10_big_fil_rev_8_21_14_0_10_35_52]